MSLSGFTFIKNGVRFGYPFEAAIKSILPLCNEVVVAVGDCDDGTREAVAAIDPVKIRIIDTIWDERLKKDGAVLADETNKAKAAVNPNADWLLYIQADECLHEQDYPEIQAALQRWKDDQAVDGLLFNYKHFYGSFDYLGTASRWYRKEIRIIKNRPDIYSYKDAQGFRKAEGEKLRVKPLQASVHHYGWVRPPQTMRQKMKAMHQLYHEGAAPAVLLDEQYDYSKDVDALGRFIGTHPAVMLPFIAAQNWTFHHDPSFNKLKWKDRFKNAWEGLTGTRPFDHNNFKII